MRAQWPVKRRNFRYWRQVRAPGGFGPCAPAASLSRRTYGVKSKEGPDEPLSLGLRDENVFLLLSRKRLSFSPNYVRRHLAASGSLLSEKGKSKFRPCNKILPSRMNVKYKCFTHHTGSVIEQNRKLRYISN